MRRHYRNSLLAAVYLLSAAQAHAELWTGIIDPSRAIDWSQAGVPGGIPTDRTQCGATIAPTSDVNVINNALLACGPNQYVKLGAGTFVFPGYPGFPGVQATRNNTTLRGSGPDKTILRFSGTGGCTGWAGLVGIGACSNQQWLSGKDVVLNGISWSTPWTEGYAKGATRLTVGSTANMAPGRLIVLDQLDDTVDDGGIVNSDVVPIFATTVGGGPGRQDTADNGVFRTQQQIVRVVSVDSATQVTIAPGLHMPNWRASQKPAVIGWGRTDDSTAFGIGLEDLTVENQVAVGDHPSIIIGNCYGCWLKNVRSLYAKRSHARFSQSARCEIRDSYFYGGQTSNSQSYGIEQWSASDNLVINNITHSVTAPHMGACQGCVSAFNYSFGNYYTDGRGCVDPTNMRNSSCNWPTHFTGHMSGGGMFLLEGNQSSGVHVDMLHGGSPLNTVFRNAFSGNDDQGGKSYYQKAVSFDATVRGNNVVGNVLGDPSLSMAYQYSDTAIPAGWSGIPAIYYLGFGYGHANGGPNPDPIVKASLLRWGNYDTATRSTRWDPSEIPTVAIPRVNGNPVPASRSLPVSFFLASRPAFFSMPWGTPAWPPIGPDVLGGNPALAGHVHDIPAKICFNRLTADPSYPSSTPRIKLFDAGGCYGASPASMTLPSRPKNLRRL